MSGGRKKARLIAHRNGCRALAASVVFGIPSGTGYTITLTGTASDGATTCGGSAGFAVTAGATSSVSLHIGCHQPSQTGSVSVGGTINVCPVIDGLGASPAEVIVGGTLALTASVHATRAARCWSDCSTTRRRSTSNRPARARATCRGRTFTSTRL